MELSFLRKLSRYKVIKKIWVIYQYLNVMVKLYVKYWGRMILGRYSEGDDSSYPKVIQLPITYKCNFDCVMCGMKNLIHNSGFSSQQLGTILKDDLFSKVEGVGINGGEPFILSDIDEYVQTTIDSLPKLKDIYIISNGYFTDSILQKSKEILEKCKKHNIKFHLSISIDGIGEMQNTMRGNKEAYTHVVETCEQIIKNRHEYCDTFGGICTVTKINVYNLAELEVWAGKNNIPMSYNVATIHRRICNDEKYNDFSVYTDEHARMIAAEFFYSKFLETLSEQYFGRYYVIKYNKRIGVCGHKNQVVTITPNGDISYCATHSKEIGNAFDVSAKKIFFSKNNLEYRKNMHNENCESCSQYLDVLQSKEYIHTFIKEVKRIRNYYI